MLTNSKFALSVALVFAAASAAVAAPKQAVRHQTAVERQVLANAWLSFGSVRPANSADEPTYMYNEDTTQCFDRESCRRAAATARCVREHIAGAFGSASRPPPRLNPWGHYIVPLAQRRLISQYCRRALATRPEPGRGGSRE